MDVGRHDHLTKHERRGGLFYRSFATLSHMDGEIRDCDWKFTFQCPQRWALLAPTEDSAVRTCDVCLKDVYLCTSTDEVECHAVLGHCIALTFDLTADPDTMLGIVECDD
jgi:hypothetical protein